MPNQPYQLKLFIFLLAVISFIDSSYGQEPPVVSSNAISTEGEIVNDGEPPVFDDPPPLPGTCWVTVSTPCTTIIRQNCGGICNAEQFVVNDKCGRHYNFDENASYQKKSHATVGQSGHSGLSTDAPSKDCGVYFECRCFAAQIYFGAVPLECRKSDYEVHIFRQAQDLLDMNSPVCLIVDDPVAEDLP